MRLAEGSSSRQCILGFARAADSCYPRNRRVIRMFEGAIVPSAANTDSASALRAFTRSVQRLSLKSQRALMSIYRKHVAPGSEQGINGVHIVSRLPYLSRNPSAMVAEESQSRRPVPERLKSRRKRASLAGQNERLTAIWRGYCRLALCETCCSRAGNTKVSLQLGCSVA